MVTEYPTERLLELSFAAYRVNKGYEKQTRRFSEGQPTQFSNKELISYSAMHYNQYNDPEMKPYIPHDFVPLKVIDEDREALERARKHMQRYTMLALGNLSDFENDIFAAYCSEKTPMTRIGFVAYLPAFVDRELADKEYRQRLKRDFNNSKHIDGDKIQGEKLEILKVVYVNKMEYEEPFYMHVGAINDNLVSFSRKYKCNVGDFFEVNARIKSKDKERESGLPLTRINYVKLKKIEV